MNYTNYDFPICNTVHELCLLRDDEENKCTLVNKLYIYVNILYVYYTTNVFSIVIYARCLHITSLI